MNANNAMYRAFNDMLKGYKTKGTEGHIMFSNAVFAWMEYAKNNPFEPQTPECDSFCRMQSYYASIQRRAVGSKFSSKQIIAEAQKLCEMKPKNPYKFDKKADEEDKAEKAAFDAEQARLAKEAEELAIQKEAERVVREEQKAKERAARKEEARLRRERQMVEEELVSQERISRLEKAIETKRAEEVKTTIVEERLASERQKLIDAKMKLEAHGAVNTKATPVLLNEIVEVKNSVSEPVKEEKKKGFFKRLFGRKE